MRVTRSTNSGRLTAGLPHRHFTTATTLQYEEDFMRLAPMLDYALAHPHVAIHVKLEAHAGAPHKWLLEVRVAAAGLGTLRAVGFPRHAYPRTAAPRR